MLSETSGDCIKAHRLRTGLVPHAVATTLGISEEEYRRFEAGQIALSPSLYRRLARCLETDVKELGGENEGEDIFPLDAQPWADDDCGYEADYPPRSKAQARYLQTLQKQAEANWAQVEARLRREAEAKKSSR